MDEHAILYGKLRAAILARHFAINKHSRANFFYEGINLSPTAVANVPNVWNIGYYGGENSLLFGGELLACLAVEYMLGRADALKIIRLALDSLDTLFKFRAFSHFAGYPIRWDPGLHNDNRIGGAPGQPASDGWFIVGQDRQYMYCTPFDDPHAMQSIPAAEEKACRTAAPGTPERDRWDRYWQFYHWHRRWEPSMDELVGFVMGHFIAYLLVPDTQVRDKIRRQLTDLGDYLAEHAYLMVRPRGGFSARGASGILPALEFPFGRVFERVTGNAYPSRTDFVGAMKTADVWKCLEFPFNAATGIGWTVGAIVSLIFAGSPLVAIVDGIFSGVTAVTLGRIAAVWGARDCFNVVNEDARGEFAIALALMDFDRTTRFTMWMSLLPLGGTSASAAAFPPFLGLTAVGDSNQVVRNSYLGWLNARRGPDLDKISVGCLASAAGVLLGAGNDEEARLVTLLNERRQIFQSTWNSDLPLTSPVPPPDGDNSRDEFAMTPDRLFASGFRSPIDYMLALAVAWWHRKNRQNQGSPVTTPGFPTLPDPSQWPGAAVPSAVIDAAVSGQITLPLQAIQGRWPLQMGSDGADLFLGDPPPGKPLVPDPIAPVIDGQLVFDRTFQIPESAGDFDTGFIIRDGDQFLLEASGQIWAGVWLTGNNGPEGWNEVTYDTKFPLHGVPNAHPYCLTAKFGAGGAYFYVGTRRPAAGWERYQASGIDQSITNRQLILRINDDSPGNGNGAFSCRVRVLRLPAAQLSVTTTPLSLPIGRAVQLMVNAVDRNTGVKVAGQVRIAGQLVAYTGVWFSYTFSSTAITGTVSAAGYPDANIPFYFGTGSVYPARMDSGIGGKQL